MIARAVGLCTPRGPHQVLLTTPADTSHPAIAVILSPDTNVICLILLTPSLIRIQNQILILKSVKLFIVA